MAYNYQANKSPSLLIILAALVLLLFANAPLGQGEILPVGNLPLMYITGKLYCTNTGNPALGASGAAGVRVNATCKGNNNNVTVGTAITNLAGLFNVSVRATIGISLSQSDSQCSVSVALPVTPGTNCTVLPLEGVLTSIPRLVRMVVTSLGVVVAELVTDLFILLD